MSQTQIVKKKMNKKQLVPVVVNDYAINFKIIIHQIQNIKIETRPNLQIINH